MALSGKHDLATVEDWVEYIQTLHVREIDMNLDRTREVYRRMLPQGLDAVVIAVAGTNGKGSTAELLSACYRAAGYQVGKYTSPHLLRYNERIQLNGNDVSDADLLAAFKLVENARETTTLTYFEFGTLVAISLMDQFKVDVAVMEVGLGGRLDAVNVLENDLAIITSISIDHASWLGDSVEAIAYEKAGIVRSNKPVVLGALPALKALTQACLERGGLVHQLGQEFLTDFKPNQPTWRWSSLNKNLVLHALPFGQSDVQLNNAACAIQALHLLAADLPISEESINLGLKTAKINGRTQIVSSNPLIILDVAHNEDSVRALARFVDQQAPQARVRAVCGMLKDKEIQTSLMQIAPLVTDWYIASISGERGSSAAAISTIVNELYSSPKLSSKHKASTTVCEFENVVNAFTSAQENAEKGDCIVVFGSFLIVADILALFEQAQKLARS